MIRRSLLAAMLSLTALAATTADYPAPKRGTWTARDFRFHTGDVMPELKLAYTTIGEPTGQPVLVLHGTAGSAASMLTPAFAGELFGPGQALDAQKYFIIIPDSIGVAGSTKPSDGLRASFPDYNYDDMVAAQHLLVTQGLKVPHLRVVLGNSMGGMHAWLWGTNFPGMMDAIVPLASQPTEMSSRNWMMRRMIIDSVRNDPAWDKGNYTTQPPLVRVANAFFGIATSGGTIAYSRQAPTREAADKLLADRLAAPFAIDANDFLYQWDASRDYNPEPNLGRITAAVLAINAADDERNPPETGVMDRALKRLPNARYVLIPASDQTRGHGTTGMARLWSQELTTFLRDVPRRGS